MSKILKREEITKEILDIINTAKEELIIVSPYIKLTSEIKQAFLNQENKVLISLVFFHDKIHQSVFDFFDRLPNVIMYANQYLHTKCYLNEKKALLTSMNLYEYSMKNNFELGVLLRYKGDDKRSYNEVREEMDFIMDKSHCITEYKIRAYENKGKTAFCTSCREPIFPTKNLKLQGKDPMDWQKEWVCSDCYKDLKVLESNEDRKGFSEKFANYCYLCGNEDDFLPLPGMIPVCISCMQKDLSPIEQIEM